MSARAKSQQALSVGGRGAGCVHISADPIPKGRVSAATAARAVAPKCYGNGVNGARVELVYMYVEGQPNRAVGYIPNILGRYVPALEGTFRTTSADQGREVGVRFHAPGCKIPVAVVELPEDAYADDPLTLMGNISETLIAAGYDETNRKYLVWFDGVSGGPLCGAALLSVVTVSPVLGDNPTPANPNNLGASKLPGLPELSVAFRAVRRSDPRVICWGRGTTGADTEIHELVHTLGAVQTSAPNSNGLGHCKDAHDLMCYEEGGVKLINRCMTPVAQLDCGADDYFNARPSVGSYLSRSWNVANSRFLGDAAEDLIPVELPRP